MNENVTIQQLDPNTFEYQTYSDLDSQLIVQSQLDTVFSASTDYIEYYVYDQNQNLIYPSTTIPLLDYDIREGDVLLDPQKDLENSGFDIGIYNILYSFYRKRLSSNISEKYFITDISSDRTEIRLDSNIISNDLIISSSNSFIQYRETAEYFVDFYLNFGNNQTVIANNIKLETEEGIDPTVLIKLYEPLPSNFGIKDELWIVEELSDPQAYELDFPFEPTVEDDFTYISGPNYNLNVIQETSTGGESFSFNTLLQSDVTSSINQIQNLLNQKEIDINVNYENYANFIHFSSAKIRLENFYYKVGLIESASNQLSEVFTTTSPTSVTPSYKESKAQLTDKIDNIIKNFDSYEAFLYFNSGSQYSYPKTTSLPPYQLAATGSTEALTWIGNATVGDPYYGGQALSASNYDQDNRNWLYWSIPEYLRDDPANEGYELFVDMVAQYYDNVWVYTKDISNKFDADNRLEYGIAKDLVADAIRDFGVKLYASNFNTNDLFTAFLGLTPSGSAFPFPNMTGSLPTESGFEYVDTEISASNDIVPLNNVQKQVYKRIYHNIPYLLKTKGTIAGIRALITSYGIPDTILRISEFGGKDRNESQDYDLKQNVFNYALDTNYRTISEVYVQSSFIPGSNWGNPPIESPQTIQFRFKPAPIPTGSNNLPSPNIRYSQSLWSTDDASFLVLEYTGSGFVTGSYPGSIPSPYDTYGTLKWIPSGGGDPNVSASLFLPFFNGDWWSVQVNIDVLNGTSSLFSSNKINGNIGFSGSDIIDGFNPSEYVGATKAYLSYGTNITTPVNNFIYQPFSGSFQELRYWNVELSESKFFDYTINPYSNEGNTINSTPNELIFRAPLGSQLDTGSRTSIHPRVTGSAVQITQSWSDSTSTFVYLQGPLGLSVRDPQFEENVEFIYQDQVPAGIKNRITDKIYKENLILAEAPYGFQTPTSSNAIIASSTSDVLSSMESIQQQSFVSQSYTPNVNYLEVGFSPSNQINDDINAQLGYFNLGDYIGDPRFISSSDYSYPDLDRLRDAYFEKYIKGYDIVDFIRLIKFFDNSLFKMIKDFTPARTSLASGVIVKQHLLERNRLRPAQVTSSNETLEGLVVNLPKDYSSGSSDYPQYSTSGSAIYKFSGGPGGVMNRFNGLQSYPSGSDGNGPNNLFLLTQSYDVVGTARDPYAYSIINGTYFNYSSSQFLSASYQGKGIENVSTQHEFYDGEFSGSGITVTSQSLNPGCSPYLNVVDKGARYNPLFFNGGINNIEQGTVSLDVFNNPNNEPINGFAWVYSQKPTNPNVIASTGADPNYNYVYSIKLSRRDIDGNDVTDYLEIGTEIEVDVPSAPTFGGGIPTYVIQGIIPEANSVRLRIALEKGDNRAWNPTIVSNKLEYQRGSVPDGPSSIASFSGSVATVLSPYDLTSLLVPSQSLFSNEFAFFPSASQASGSGEGTIAISYTDNFGFNQFTYNYSGAFEDTNNPAYNGIFRFNVDPATVMAMPPTAELPLVGQNFNISIRTSGQSFFPITSSTAGGSENWSFIASTTYTSSDSRVDENDLRQQNVFKSSISTDQTQFVTVYSDPAKSVLNPPEYNDPLINSVGGTNPWYGPNGLASTNAQPLLLGVNGTGQGETGFFLASGMLNANNQNEYQNFINSGDTQYSDTDIIDDVWRYSSYNLYRTPNVPLNFSMSFYYSASDLDTGGGGETTFTSEGTVHDGQGYNPNNVGNTSQAFTLTGQLQLAVEKLFTSTGSGYATLSEALNAGNNEINTSASNGEIFGPGNFFTTNHVLYQNNQLTSVWTGYDASPTNYTFHVLRNSSGFAGVGRIGILNSPNTLQLYDPSSPNFNALYNTSGQVISKLNGDDATESITSGIFVPPTLNESVSTPVFNDNINNLIPGNSGSVETGSILSNPAGHPKIALNGTASLNYNFGKFKFAGSPSTQLSIIPTPFSASAAANSPNTDDFQTPSPNTTYWGMNTTTDGAYTIDQSDESTWIALVATSTSTNTTAVFSIQPYFAFDIYCYVPVGTADFDLATAQVLFTDWDGQVTDFNVIGTIQPVLQNNGATFNITNPVTSLTQEVQLWRFVGLNENNGSSSGKVYFAGASPGESVEYQLNIRTINPVDFTVYINNWEITKTRANYTYNNNGTLFNSFVLFQSGNGTMQSSFGASNDLQGFPNQTNNAILSGSIDVEGLLKYTGSINDGTQNGQVVDTVITRTSKGTFDIYNSAVIDLSTLTNAVGTFTNDVEYDISDVTKTSSTRNLAGGMYYLEYSMSNYINGPTNNFDFEFITDSSQVIGITQSVTQEATEVADPSATILPQIIYGNSSNRSTFGEIVQFTSGEVPSVLVANSESIGHYSFSGSFLPTDGWQLNDSLRMAFRVTKSGANIGVTVISSSLGISPGQSIYSPITSSNPPTAPNPDVFRVPTITQFAIPTFYQNGVLPFGLALDCQPLLNNYNDARRSSYIMDVDYNNESGPVIPVNQAQILAGTAIRAAVPDSNYSSQTWTTPRYIGSRSNCRIPNIYSYGDTGTYGQLPNIEVRLAYFAYFESITNPYPLYNNATQLNVAYLIDEQENALPPSLGAESYEIMNILYPPDSQVSIQVNSGSSILQELNGTNKIKSIGQRYEPICFSQTSSQGYANLIPLSGSGRISVYDNVGTAAAKSFFGVSVMGSGVTNVDEVSALQGSNTFQHVLAPEASIVTASYNNVNPNDVIANDNAPYSGSGVFFFSSSIDKQGDGDLSNPQTIFLDTTFITSFLYESGTDEMRIKLKCVLERDGTESNIDFELDDLTMTAYYLGQSRDCGSILGKDGTRSNWRGGVMVTFVTPNQSTSTLKTNVFEPQRDANNEYNMLFENPVINDLLINRGVNWKRHGGVENGGPVDYLEWKITANTGNFIFKAGDKVRFELFGNMTQTGRGRSRLNKFYPQGYITTNPNPSYLPTNFTVIGANDSAEGDNSASAPYWGFTGSGQQEFLEIVAPNFNEAYGTGFQQGFLPYEPGSSEFFEIGFEPTNTKFPRVKQPLKFKINDEIRFVNNENYTYTILEVIPPEENIDVNGQGKVKIRLDKEVPSSINKDFFLVRRPINDASITYLDLNYPYDADITNVNLSSSNYSSAGLILPTFPSEFINISSSQIINNLISKGVIKP